MPGVSRSNNRPRDTDGVLRLPNAERDVLAALDRLGESTSKEICDQLRTFRKIEHGTVAILLGRLEDKGLVTRRKGPVGKARLFKSNGHARRLYHTAIHDMIQRTFGGDSVAAFATLVSVLRFTSDEAAALRRLTAVPASKFRSVKR